MTFAGSRAAFRPEWKIVRVFFLGSNVAGQRCVMGVVPHRPQVPRPTCPAASGSTVGPLDRGSAVIRGGAVGV